MNNNKYNPASNFTQRENFLISLLNKVIREYKDLLENYRRIKPFKIVEILKLSSIPGESRFIIQITNKNSIVKLSAAEIINNNYNLDSFSDFHAEMIRQAARGTLREFLRSSGKKPLYKIISKYFDKKRQKYIFILENRENIRFNRTAEELSLDNDLLSNIDIQDIYDIGYTQGTESILKEKNSLLLIKKNKF